MKSLAIVPARSGSKGLPNKNIKKLCGKPLMAYSIQAAIKSKIFDVIHVSTDSEQYAEIGKTYGADIPFLRSPQMSSDMAGSWDMVQEVLDNYKKKGKVFDMVTLLQPTSPLRDEHDIIEAYKLYRDKPAQAVISVCEVEHSPLWCDVLPKDCSMCDFGNGKKNLPRQSLSTYYRYNGAIYMVAVPFLMESQKLTREGCFAYIMNREKSIDIDTQLDFDFAEFMIRQGNRERDQVT